MVNTSGKREKYKIVSKDGFVYTIRWGWNPWLDDEGHELEYGYWSEHSFFSKPDLNQVKNTIINFINEDTDYKILTGFRWMIPSTANDDEPKYVDCYLSSENQFNYKAAYDLAFQTEGASLPFILKFGSTTQPEYYEFKTLEEFNSFYGAVITFINTKLQEGWVKKDSIDWDAYQEELDKID